MRGTLIWYYIGMVNIDILVCNYCEAIIMIIDLPVSTLKTVYTCVKPSINVSKHCKTCHDKYQLSQYCMIIASHNYCQ